MILFLWSITGCDLLEDRPADRPTLLENKNFETLCVDNADVAYCLEKAEAAPASWGWAQTAYTVACAKKHPGACEHFVRNFHEQDTSRAILYAATSCREDGVLCDELFSFQDRYPEQAPLLEKILPDVRQFMAEREGTGSLEAPPRDE